MSSLLCYIKGRLEQLTKAAVFSRIPVISEDLTMKSALSKEDELLQTSSDEEEDDEEADAYYNNA